MDKVAVIAVAPREAVDGGRAVSAIASAHPSALVWAYLGVPAQILTQLFTFVNHACDWLHFLVCNRLKKPIVSKKTFLGMYKAELSFQWLDNSDTTILES